MRTFTKKNAISIENLMVNLSMQSPAYDASTRHKDEIDDDENCDNDLPRVEELRARSSSRTEVLLGVEETSNSPDSFKEGQLSVCILKSFE